MKKVTLLIFIVSSFTFVKGNSGDSNRIKISSRFNIGISVGLATPAGSFGVPASFHLHPFQDTISGFAKSGFHFDFNAEAYPLKNFGFIISVGGNINLFNATAYNNSINYSEPTTATTTANAYYVGEYMGGICYRGIISNKVGIHLGLLFGVMTSNYPMVSTSFSATSTQSAGTFTWSAQSTDAFSWNLKGGFNYKLRKDLDILLDLSYSQADLNYPSSTYTETLQGGPTFTISGRNPSTMSLGLIKLTIGVAYCF